MPVISKTDQSRIPQDFWDLPVQEVLSRLGVTADGLSDQDVQLRRASYGPNVSERERRFAAVQSFLRFFLNPLVAVLLLASLVSYFAGGHINAAIIVVIVVLSIILSFTQEYQAQHAAEKLRQQVASTARVLRDGKEQDIPLQDLVPGDIVKLEAGSLVPADGRLLTEDDLHVRESALTGESLPVEKDAGDLPPGHHDIAGAQNSVFLGTAVQSGLATMVVVHTGAATVFGGIAGRLAQREPETEFDHGIRHFGYLIMRIILLLVLFVFLINVAFNRPLLDSFLFAVALAVGLTPELLPVIMTVTLAQGARRMACKKVIVKQLASIENLGSMEILCCDKTGTLTIGDVVFEKHLDLRGNDSGYVLQLMYLNSYFEAGVKSPLDDAVLRHEKPDIGSYQKIEEIPFDFERRRLSVVVKKDSDCLLITKGAVENVLEVSTMALLDGKTVPFSDECRRVAEDLYQRLSEEGYRVLAVATRNVPYQPAYHREDEKEMTLIGLAAFMDPPKPDVQAALAQLKSDRIDVLVMTGDNEYVTRKIAHDVGLSAERIIVGADMDAMDDGALVYQAEHGAIFARVSPEQKNRVITALRARGWVVGFLGDGINDAPSMHTADVGISVVNGVDVAKDAANIILLEKDLKVLHDGISEGRRSFANIMKYIIMGTSSNFGNMFSMAAASLFLPFLPMLPTQILLNNLLYDASQISIPSDTVDSDQMRSPKRWRIDFIRQFMLIIGPISSIYDFLTFGLLLMFFHAGERLFHTGWFVESLATQTLVVFVIRTTQNPLKSRPATPLLVAVLAVVAISFILPFTALGRLLGFTPLPLTLLLAIVVLTVTYLALVQLVKMAFYRRHAML